MDYVSMDDILAGLDKKTLESVHMAKDISKEVLPTASYGINKEIGGGLRLGHQHTVYGAEGSAKTALMLQTVAVNQAQGIPCVWFDAEGVFDPDWAARLGVDVDRLVIPKFASIAKVTDEQVNWIKRGVRLIVIDSTSELMQTSLVDGEEVKNFDDTKQQGTQAKDLGKMSKMIQGMNYTCAIVHISQVRVDLGAAAMNKPFMPAGGKELRHNDTLRVRVSGTKATDKQLTGQVKRGEILVEQQIGYPVTWKVEKNRLNGNEGHGMYNFYKAGDKIGIDRTGELVDAGQKYGIIEGSTWLNVYGEKIQGAKNAVKYLDSHPEVLEKLEQEIDAKSV